MGTRGQDVNQIVDTTIGVWDERISFCTEYFCEAAI